MRAHIKKKNLDIHSDLTDRKVLCSCFIMLNSEVGGEIQESTSIEHGEGMNMVRPAQ